MTLSGMRRVRDAQGVGDVPTGAVHGHGGVLVRRERGRETVQERLHGFGRDARHDEREAVPGRGPHRREQVRPGVPLIAQAGRTPAPGEPAVAHAPLLAEAHLVLEPERQAPAGMLGRDAVQFALKPPFANASRAAGSALGCEGLAFCRDRPSARTSLDMWPSW